LALPAWIKQRRNSFGSRLCVVVAISVFLASCSKPPNIVGTWTSGLGGALTTYHFKPDGTFSFDSLFDGYMSHVDGKYHFEGKMLFLDPSGSNVQGAGPRVEEMKAQLAQSSRLTFQMYTPGSFRLGKEDPPLVVSKVSPNP
jgi:hypothetical protein